MGNEVAQKMIVHVKSPFVPGFALSGGDSAPATSAARLQALGSVSIIICAVN